MKRILVTALALAMSLAGSAAFATDADKVDISGDVELVSIAHFTLANTTGLLNSADAVSSSILGGTDVSGDVTVVQIGGATIANTTGLLNRSCAKSASIGDGCT